ncbi:MAG: SAM-dependent methyltransferase, partial [Verrucomicrobiota bacterium]
MGTISKRLVGRAGLKLEAAIERFALAEPVRGARAIDIGASTGGFTQVLLDHGATHVTAVDAGRDQLHERLRQDPRVLSLEETDWKRLALSEAEGPFDFFTVDVSFVAARNMLRGLAFRLRAGAPGVVLLKPQFELPDHLVRGGDVSDPALRMRALSTFTKKAEGLGFRVVAHADSPVAGGEGTVEILAHLVFDGRGDTLPRPGEKRPVTVAPRGRRAPADSMLTRPIDWFAVVAPGVEEVAAREVERLPGVAKVKAVGGGVDFRGPVDVGMRANLDLRVPTRVLLRLGEVRAREFGKLRHQLARLPWEDFLPAGAPVRTTITTKHCRLYHTGAIDEAVRAAMSDRLSAALPAKGAAGMPDVPLVLLRGVDDVWTVSVDSSGERLHRRGWRTEAGEAPLRESLAAALLALAEWQPREALVDPMCGVGTIPIEAAAISLGIAPGAHRAFAFERWPGTPAAARERWAAARRQAEDARPGPPAAPIAGSDRDPAAVAAARRNAARAGVQAHLTLAERALADLHAPASSGLLIANPPYGERLGGKRDLPALYREIGKLLAG